MRPLPLLAAFVVVVLAACSGGPGTVGTGGGVDPAPTSGDKAGSSSELPPSSTDPTTTAHGGACFACVNWVCGTGTSQLRADLSSKVDGCYLDTYKIDTCGTTTVQPKNDLAVTFTGTATGLRVCVHLTQTSEVCVDCVPEQVKTPNSPDAG